MGMPGGMPGGGPNTAYAQNKVNGPAIGLMVTAILGILTALANMVVNGLGIGGVGAAGNPNMPPEAAQIQMLSGAMGVVFAILGIIMQVVVLVGALKMKKLEAFGFAMAASIIAMIPCLSPCCIVGLPIGIWALVTLNDAQVKAAFR